MNSQENILRRLLKVYPVALLKQLFDKTNIKQDDLINEIVIENNRSDILNICNSNFDFIKQHVYVYEIADAINFDILLPENKTFDFRSSNQQSVLLTYFLSTEYRLILLDMLALNQLIFLWPIRIIIKDNFLILKMATLERNLDSYFESSIKNLGKAPEESDIIQSFESFMQTNGRPLVRVDLTRGIKEIWEQNYIDAPYVKFKKSRSTSTEAMDEDYTLKQQYPEVYQEIMRGPIDRTIFRFLTPNDFVQHFRVEPTIGKLAFSIFPTHTEANDNVINLILRNNN